VAIFFMPPQDKAMRKWTGEPSNALLPADVGKALMRRSKHVLERHGAPDEAIAKLVNALFDQVSWAYAEREYKLEADGPGHPVSGPANLLTVNVDDLLRENGLRGNWLKLGDDEEQGAIGLVAELEAIAQTAFREACGEQAAVMARPARITKAHKTLGKVHRTKLPDLIVWGPVFEAGPFCVHCTTDQ
jgi:hypothetical protein